MVAFGGLRFAEGGVAAACARAGTVLLYRVCHSAIHARFTEAELARRLATAEALREDPSLEAFVAWIRTKPPDFYAPTRMAKARTRKWR